MAIAPGSYSFMGGAVLGKGSEGQFVLVRSGSLLTAFTDDEYNACLEAVHDGKAVCVQYKIGPVTFQTQLLNVTGLGDLQFVDTSVQNVTHYRVAGTSPHTVSIVKTGSAQQFVLERDDMSTAFTASEYIQCQSRISEGSAVCVQWKSGSDRMQAQLSAMLADGAMLFSFTAVDLETIFIVSGSDPHNITAHTNSLGGSQVQSNWTESDTTSPAYIRNKPILKTVATTGRYSDLIGKPTIPAEQVNSDWSAPFGKAKILNKPITMPNTTGGLRKTLDSDDITNGYVEFKIDTDGSFTGPNAFTNPVFVLFGNLYQLRYNRGPAANYIDTAEVGLYSDGIVGEHVKYYENSHAELFSDNAKGWGVSGWWSLEKDKYLSVYVRLTLTSSAAVGNEVFCHFTSGIFGTGLFNN